MRPVLVARDVVESETRIELNGPLRRLKIMRRDRELRKREAPPCAPEDDATAMLRRSVNPGLQDAEAYLIPVHGHAIRPFEQVLSLGVMVGNVERDVPERCERAKDKLDNTVSDDIPFLWSRLVDLKFVTQEAEHVFKKEELRPIELHIRQHVAHQRVPAIWAALEQRRRNITVHRGLPRVIWLLRARDVRIRLLSCKKRPGLPDVYLHG